MIILERILDHSRESDVNAPMGTLGELYIGGEFQCYTIEQPWRDNRRFVSCIPAGEYDITKYDSPKYGAVVALSNPDLGVVIYETQAGETDRYACLIHAANWSHQLQGCIAPGANLAWGKHETDAENFKSNLMVTASRNTLAKLLPEITGEKILIRWKNH